MRTALLLLILTTIAGSASALPSGEETRTFEQTLAADRVAFEQEIREFSPGPAAKEIEKFREQEVARKTAFDTHTASMPLEEKVDAIATYQAERRAAETALHTALEKLDSSPVKARNERAAYQKNKLALKQSFDQATATMPLAEKRAAIAAYAEAVRKDEAAKTAELREPIIEENLPDKRRAFEKKMIEKQRAFYTSTNQ